MRRCFPKHRSRASTLTDLLIVIVTIALLAAYFLAVQTRPRGSRINCISNLKQVGLTFLMWSSDHNDTFPMSVSTNEGGSMEFKETREVFRHFLVMSNELSTPKILVCPQDRRRRRTSVFDQTFSNGNLSLFVGLDANKIDPTSLLSGDRTITTNGRIMSGLLTLTTNSPVSWAKGLHEGEGNVAGNVALSDGSVQQPTHALLKKFIWSSTNLPARLAIP